MNIKIEIEHIAGNGEKRIIGDSDRFLIGLDGTIYENYGESWQKPMWEQVFDADVRITKVNVE